MELLTYIGQVAKRKDRFIERASDLADANPSVPQMEDEMRERTSGLVTRLRRDKMRFTEFERAAADDTITAALAGVMLGDERNSKLKDQTFAAATKTMPYLWEFYREIQWSLNNGKIEFDNGEDPNLGTATSGRSPSKYAKLGYNSSDPELLQDMIDVMPTRQPKIGKSRPLVGKVLSLDSATTSQLLCIRGSTLVKWTAMRSTGFKQMRRVLDPQAKHCQDCLNWASMDWQALGTLPPPGERCQCLFNCRCSIDYR